MAEHIKYALVQSSFAHSDFIPVQTNLNSSGSDSSSGVHANIGRSRGLQFSCYTFTRRGHMVLYSTATRCCFFSAEPLRDRLAACPLTPCWRAGATAPPGSSLSPVSSLGLRRAAEGLRKREGDEDDEGKPPRGEPVPSASEWRANTFCFFQVSSG